MPSLDLKSHVRIAGIRGPARYDHKRAERTIQHHKDIARQSHG
jgi:hypothetical protein